MADNFYNVNRLLTMKDADGLTPEVFLVEGNRTAGKTFSIKDLLIKRFIRKQKKFCVLVRETHEMDAIEDTFFKDVITIKYPKITPSSDWVGARLFKNLYMDGKHCGYCVALNSADKVKMYSSMFVDVDIMFFDEFQSEMGKYCPNEITKFISVHVSMARGGGKQVRYLPVIMASNSVSIVNPYYTLFGISKLLTPSTKFLRGHGWVLERTFNENAAEALQTSAFGRAVSSNKYIEYASTNKSLLDTNNFIRKEMPNKTGIYANMLYDGVTYGVWEVDHGQYLWVSRKHDPNYFLKLTCNPDEHDVSYILQKRSAPYNKGLSKMFEQGRVFFEDLECKNAFLDFIGMLQM